MANLLNASRKSETPSVKAIIEQDIKMFYENEENPNSNAKVVTPDGKEYYIVGANEDLIEDIDSNPEKYRIVKGVKESTEGMMFIVSKSGSFKKF